jgi:sulfate permease, SulP family
LATMGCSTLSTLVPIKVRLSGSIGNYRWSALRSDLIAGATVAAIAIPQAIAYALIAGVDPKIGLYSAIVLTIVASLFNSSSHLINGPTNAVSLVVFSALASFDGRFEAYEALFLLCIMIGVIQIFVAVLRLGDLTRYVSESVILGFMAGAGLLIALGQVGNFVGAAKKAAGDPSVIQQTWAILAHGYPFNSYAIGLGTGTILLVLLLRRLINRYQLPKIDMLAGLIIASLVAAYFGWSLPTASGKSLIATVGTVPAALPGFYIPQPDLGAMSKLLTAALAISLLGLLEALAVAKSIAVYTRQPLDYNRQCLAEGVGNLVGGFFQSLPGSGSLTRSAINYQSGAVTRVSGIFSGVIVAAVVLVGGPYARFIPKPALAGLLFITAARLIDWKRLAYTVRASRFDAILVVATGLTAVLVSVDYSILIGVALSILLFVTRASKPSMRELIITPERVVRERQPQEERSGPLLIYDLEGELFFGAAPELERYLADILEEANRAGIRHVVVRFRRARNPDAGAIEHLERFLRDAQELGVTVLLAGVRPDFVKILRNVGINKWFPTEQIFPEEDQMFSATLRAVRYGNQLATRSGASKGANAGDPRTAPDQEEQADYYLV